MPTYKALLRGDRLEWLENEPESLPDAILSVEVTLEETALDRAKSANGPAMAILLEKLAAQGTFSDIAAPKTWQRELRQDRPLPGRTG